jgi:hypothetical protein
MVRRVLIDTMWSPRKHRDSKMHVCYDPEEDVFIEVDSLMELKDYDKIYLDSSIFPNMWGQLRELISNGGRIYYFARPWKWKSLGKKDSEMS